MRLNSNCLRQNHLLVFSSALSLFATGLFLSFPSSGSSQVSEFSAPIKSKFAQIEDIYIPADYDSDDNAEIMTEGFLANDCWKIIDTHADIDSDRQIIRIGTEVTRITGLCAQSMRPFQSVFHLGKLAQGTYSIIQNFGDRDSSPVGELKISSARTDKIGGRIYAPVAEVNFHSDTMSGGILIKGFYPTNCMRIENLPVKIDGRIIVIEPIVKIREDGTCKTGSFPFHAVTHLDFIKTGHYLLQVRTMSGNSINRIIEIN
jgi:hypothetical protein